MLARRVQRPTSFLPVEPGDDAFGPKPGSSRPMTKPKPSTNRPATKPPIAAPRPPLAPASAAPLDFLERWRARHSRDGSGTGQSAPAPPRPPEAPSNGPGASQDAPKAPTPTPTIARRPAEAPGATSGLEEFLQAILPAPDSGLGAGLAMAGPGTGPHFSFRPPYPVRGHGAAGGFIPRPRPSLGPPGLASMVMPNRVPQDQGLLMALRQLLAGG